MKHIAFQTFIDYLEGRLSATEQGTVESHLDSCPECQRELELARSVISGDHTFREDKQPSQDLLNRLKTAFRRHRDRTMAQIEQSGLLQFDSATSPLALGIRGTSNERQMLYSVGSFDLDLQISKDISSETLALNGQILPTEDQTGGLDGRQVKLIDRNNDERIGLTDDLGRFNLSYLQEGQYSLRISFDNYDMVIEPLDVKCVQ
ncbi:zf-HC2 domain-containing protein [Chloroflexi bacterium TSY]|nr:zf-HC2 domain-containing protein [Chloroflexi bacterium TSY]